MATRAASKLEDQMAALLAKIDKQSEQLENLTRQQSERVDDIARKQQETDELVHAIEDGLHEVKTAVDGRLSAMEGSLTGLRSDVHSELLEEQERLRKQIRDDVLRDFSTPTGLGEGLRPTAPSFVPATTGPEEGTLPGAGLAGSAAAPGGSPLTGMTRQRAAPFDGKSAWDVYRAQFELLADMNRWSDAEKATHLAISLRGAASTVLTNLHPTQRQNYEALTAALDSRFGTAHQSELNRMRLKARNRRRDETLADLAEDVERLVRLAYPGATEAMVEVLAKDQFVDALPDEDTRLRIRQNKPATLRDALGTALELESYRLASKQKAWFVRGAQLEDVYPVQRQMSEPGTSDVLQQLVEALRHLTARSRADLGGPLHPGKRGASEEMTGSAGSARRGATVGGTVRSCGLFHKERRTFPSRETSSSRACGAKLG